MFNNIIKKVKDAAGVHNVVGSPAVTGVGPDDVAANAAYAFDADVDAVDVVAITVEMPRCKVSKFDNRIPSYHESQPNNMRQLSGSDEELHS